MKKRGIRDISKNYTLPNDLNAINTFINNLIEKHDLSFYELVDHLHRHRDILKPESIPSCIFTNKKLGILESVTKYLKEEFKLSFHNIALLLNRNDRVVWITYNNAQKKKKDRFVLKKQVVWLPVSIFTDKNQGPLESITRYLRERFDMTFNEIAKLLDRDNRVIWAVYNKKKKEVVKNENKNN